MVLMVDFIIGVTLLRFICQERMLTIFEMGDMNRLMKVYLSDACLIIARIIRYFSVVAPFAIASYLTSVIYYFAQINDQTSQIDV